MSIEFNGRTALITGAGQGLGRDFAMQLAARGCQVVVNDLSKGHDSSAERVVQEIRDNGGVACSACGDVVTDAEQIIAKAIEEFGALDIVINNAGILDWKLFSDMSVSDFDRVLSVHLNGTVNVLKAAWPHLVKSTASHVVNVSSAATFGLMSGSPYATAKMGVVGLTRSLALEGQEVGIVMNAIMPLGYTEMSATMPEPYKSMFQQNLPSQAVAPFVLWLAHEQTDVTGEVFSVGGGRVARVLIGEAEGIKAESNTPEQWAALATSLIKNELSVLPETSFGEALHSLEELGVDPSLFAVP